MRGLVCLGGVPLSSADPLPEDRSARSLGRGLCWAPALWSDTALVGLAVSDLGAWVTGALGVSTGQGTVPGARRRGGAQAWRGGNSDRGAGCCRGQDWGFSFMAGRECTCCLVWVSMVRSEQPRLEGRWWQCEENFLIPLSRGPHRWRQANAGLVSAANQELHS